MESTSLVKGIALLEALASHGGQAGLAQLAAMAGVAKPSTHRILSSLMSLGYVERHAGGVYRLTGRLRLVARGFAQSQLVELAEPILQQLSARTGETVNLGVLRHHGVMYLRVLESQHALRRVANPDDIDPFYSTALGRAIVAHLPEPQREMLLREVALEQRTERTVIDPAVLRQMFCEVRRQGYAVEEDQTDLGVTCLGAAVIQRDQAVAAISLSVPTIRSNGARRADLIAAVRAAAAALSEQLNLATGVSN